MKYIYKNSFAKFFLIFLFLFPQISLAAGESLDFKTISWNDLLNPQKWVEAFKNNISFSFIPSLTNQSDGNKNKSSLNVGIPGLSLDARDVINFMLTNLASLWKQIYHTIINFLNDVGLEAYTRYLPNF